MQGDTRLVDPAVYIIEDIMQELNLNFDVREPKRILAMVLSCLKTKQDFAAALPYQRTLLNNVILLSLKEPYYTMAMKNLMPMTLP